jgi:hypothetical protein
MCERLGDGAPDPQHEIQEGSRLRHPRPQQHDVGRLAAINWHADVTRRSRCSYRGHRDVLAAGVAGQHDRHRSNRKDQRRDAMLGCQVGEPGRQVGRNLKLAATPRSAVARTGPVTRQPDSGKAGQLPSPI